MKFGRIVLGVALSLAVFSAPADARHHRIRKIDVAGALATEATSVKDGYLTGYYIDTGGNPRGYWKRLLHKTAHLFDVPGATSTIPTGLTISPTLGPLIGGSYTDANGRFHGFTLAIETGDVATFADHHNDTKANAINSSGEVAGSVAVSGVQLAYYVKLGGELKKIRIPDATNGSEAKAINARGDLAGTYVDDVGNKGFFRNHDGQIVEFHFGDLAQTSALAINDKRVIVGWSGDNAIFTSGMVRTPDGQITVFDYPGAKSTLLDSINNSGVSVGTYMDTSNITHGLIRAKNGNLKTLDVPAADQTFPLSIDEQGDVAGIIFDSEGEHGFEWVPQ